MKNDAVNEKNRTITIWATKNSYNEDDAWRKSDR